MKYKYMDKYWKRIFQMEWKSVSEGSKAIAAIIISDKGEIISEGRNMIGINKIPNPKVLHAETEAVRNLDIAKYPDLKLYTLITALEPCPMCLGTLVMGGIRNVIIGTKDMYGGAMDLINHSTFLKSKNINITWMDSTYGDIQRALQTIKELLYNKDNIKLSSMLEDFSVYNRKGVEAAKKLVSEGWFLEKSPSSYEIEEIYDRLAYFIFE